MTYCVDQFQGLIPRLDEAALPGNAALIARDVNLSHGRIDSWRTPLVVEDFMQPVHSIHSVDGHWRGFTRECLEFVTARPCKDTYVSQPCEIPLLVKDWCSADPRCIALGVPVPDAPEVVSYGPEITEPDQFTESRSYAITYCNDCFEGSPSKLTDPIKADKDSSVVLRICPPEDTEYEVTHVNIYVTHDTWDVSQGYNSESQDDISSGLHAVDGARVECFLVGSVDMRDGCVEFSDSPGSAATRLGRSLTTEGFLPPIRGLIIFGETDRGSLVGGVGNRIYFSERNAHWAWPTRNCHILNCEFRGGCVMGNSVIVLTEANPYIILDDAEGLYDGSAARTITELPVSQPLVSRKSLVCTNTGATYASDTGIVRVTSDGAVDMLSTTHFTPEDWSLLDPASIRAAEYRGSYFFTSTGFSGSFDLNLGGLSAPGPLNLTEVCARPDCWKTNKEGDLFFLQDDVLYKWNAGPDWMPHDYLSAVTELPRPLSLTAARVEYSNLKKADRLCDPSTIEFLSDGDIRCSRSVEHRCAVRISLDNVCDIQFRVRGTRSIRRVCIATDTITLGDN